MTEPLRLPVGIDDFEKIRKSDFYYGLFNGLYITGNQKLCEEYMGKYPVIFISLKRLDILKKCITKQQRSVKNNINPSRKL